MSLPSLSTIGLWTSIGSIYFVGGKTLKNAKNNNILILTRQVADHSRFQDVPLIPIPPTEPGIRTLLNSSAVPNSGTKQANFDSLTDFHFISVQNWWNFDRKLECKHGTNKTAFRVRNAGYREFRETRPAGPRRSEGKRQKQTKTTTTATKTGRNSANQRVKRAEWWTGWLHSPIGFFSSPLPNFFFTLFFPSMRSLS